MRKYAFFALIVFIMSVIAGCGSGGPDTTVIANTNNIIKADDITNYISGKTLYCVSSTTGSPVTYLFGAGTTSGTLTKNGVLDGTWTFTAATGEIIVSPASGTMNLNRIQVEAAGSSTEYWLVYDANISTVPANKIYRFYVDQTNGLNAAKAYITSITTTLGLTFPQVLMGGTVQGQALNIAGTVDTINVSTFAGSDIDTPADITDGLKTAARFNHPTGITTDGKGSFYVTDTANHTIRKISSTGNVTTIAGVAGIIGSADTTATNTVTTFSSPQGITSDGTYLYVADTGNSTIRRIDLSTTPCTVTTLAGIPGSVGAVDNTATGASAQFYQPVGITNDGTNLYVTDVGYHTIRKVKIATVSATDLHSQSVTTLAGSPNAPGLTDDFGTAARFNVPLHITTDGTNLYVTDLNNHAIRKIVIATGKTTTIADNSSVDENGALVRFYFPSGITTDGTNLYITEFNESIKSNPVYLNLIRKLAVSGGVVSIIAGGTSSNLNSVDTSVGVAPRFSKPLDITSNGTSLFVTNYSNGYTDVVAPAITYPSFNNIRQIGP